GPPRGARPWPGPLHAVLSPGLGSRRRDRARGAWPDARHRGADRPDDGTAPALRRPARRRARRPRRAAGPPPGRLAAALLRRLPALAARAGPRAWLAAPRTFGP